MRDMQNDVFYLKEAFKKLSTLNEDSFDLTSDVGVIDELQSFVADDIDAPYEEEIIDIDADNNEELLDSYVGKCILQCNCCNTKVYKDIKDIIVDEETETANVEEECPKCGNAFGWTVIGKIEPFDENEFEDQVDDQQPTVELELTDDEISEALKESLNEDDNVKTPKIPKWWRITDTLGQPFEFENGNYFYTVKDVKNYFPEAVKIKVIEYFSDEEIKEKPWLVKQFYNHLNEDIDIHVGETPEGELKVEVEADDQDIIEIEKENIDDVVVDVDESCRDESLDEDYLHSLPKEKEQLVNIINKGGENKDREIETYLTSISLRTYEGKEDAEEWANYINKLANGKLKTSVGGSLRDNVWFVKSTGARDGEPVTWYDLSLDEDNLNILIDELGLKTRNKTTDESLKESWDYAYDYAKYSWDHPEVDIEKMLKDDGKDEKFINDVFNLLDEFAAEDELNRVNESLDSEDLAKKFIDYANQNGTNSLEVRLVKNGDKRSPITNDGYCVELNRNDFIAYCKFKDNGDILYIDTNFIDDDLLPEGADDEGFYNVDEKYYKKFNSYDSFIDYITDREVIDNGYVDPDEKFYDAKVIFTKDYHMTDHGLTKTKDDKDYYKNYLLEFGIVLNGDNSLDIPAGYKTHILTVSRNKHGDVSRLYLPYKLSLEFDPVKLKKDGVIITGINESLEEDVTIKPETSVEHDQKLENSEENPVMDERNEVNLKESVDRYKELKKMASKVRVDYDSDAMNKFLDELNKALRKKEITERQVSNLEKLAGLEFDESLKESIDNLSLDTDTTHMEMTSDDNGKVTIVTEPRENANDVVETGEEMIAPLTDEEQTEIMNNEVDSTNEFEIDEFDEESFDELGESFLKRVYENVNSFKTTEAKYDNNKLYVEGLIKFNSGKEKKTTFKFENFKKSKKGKLVISGLNETFAKNKKAFSLKGSLVNKHFVSESLVYKYNTKNINEGNKNEVVNVFGKVVIKK